MLNYRVEKLDSNLKEEMSAMAGVLYWEEVAAPFHRFPPDVDWGLYETLENADRLRVVVGRDQGKLKAFAVVVLGAHPHYACICGSVPLLFLHPDHRKGSEGMRLVRLLEKAAEEAGAQIIITHGGMHNNVYKLFEGMHYQDFGRYFVKVKENGVNGLTPIFKNREE